MSQNHRRAPQWTVDDPFSLLLSLARDCTAAPLSRYFAWHFVDYYISQKLSRVFWDFSGSSKNKGIIWFCSLRHAICMSFVVANIPSFSIAWNESCKELRVAKCESALINQFLRSGTSIGANIREAFYAHGKADFIAKLQIALKECSETEYWIELVLESGYYHDKTLLDKCTELKRILISSLNTAKANQDNK